MSNTRPKNLDNDLRQFTGTDGYYRSVFFSKDFHHTDGVQHLTENYKCMWLLDVIFSHVAEINNNPEISERDKSFMVCELRLSPDENIHHASFKITNGDGKDLATQHIPYTDFPAQEQDVWVVDNIALLPSEY